MDPIESISPPLAPLALRTVAAARRCYPSGSLRAARRLLMMLQLRLLLECTLAGA